MDRLDFTKRLDAYLATLSPKTKIGLNWIFMGKTDERLGSIGGPWSPSDAQGYLIEKGIDYRFILRFPSIKNPYIVIESKNYGGQLVNYQIDEKLFVRDGAVISLLETKKHTLTARIPHKDYVTAASELGLWNNIVLSFNEDTFNPELVLTDILDWGTRIESIKKKIKSQMTKMGRIIQNPHLENYDDNLTPELSKIPLNTILYGPPGTGKTYNTVDLAVKIAAPDEYAEGNHEANKLVFERLLQPGQIAFSTFHQSMNYEDFIEGIKPTSDESSGLSYSVEDGIFKQLAINAAFEYVGKKSSDASKSLTFSYVYDQLLDEVTGRIGKEKGNILKLRSGSEIEIVEITAASNFLVRHKNGSRTYTVSRRRLEKLFTELPDLDIISNINEEIRKIIGGSNASAYWAVLKKIRSFKVDVKTAFPGKKYSYEDKAAAVEKLQPEDVIPSGNEKKFVLIIDEINRGNVSQIFGELITLIEDDKRFGKGERLSAILPYSRSRFFVPPNLYIIGTMNTADRSVEALDTALRRRFSFIEMAPEYDLPGMEKEIAGVRISELLETLNNRIEKLIDRDHRIGHSYFLGINSTEDLMTVFRNKVIPLFQEYFYGNYEKMGLVLGKGFIEKLPDEKVRFASFPADENDFNDRVIYRINRYSVEDTKAFEQAITHLLNWQ